MVAALRIDPPARGSEQSAPLLSASFLRARRRAIAATWLGIVALSLWFCGLVWAGYRAHHPLANTKLPPGFSVAEFRALRPGMSREEVRRRVGTPISWSMSEGAEWWSLAGGAKDNRQGHCVWFRCVFDLQTGLLSEAREEVYWDILD